MKQKTKCTIEKIKEIKSKANSWFCQQYNIIGNPLIKLINGRRRQNYHYQ